MDSVTSTFLTLGILFISFHINETLAATRVINIAPTAGNSMVSAIVQDFIGSDPKKTKYFRVERVHATITPQTLTARTPDREFSSADKRFMKKFLQSRQDDEAGHLIAATLGGTNSRYNLAPQHNTLNRNVNEASNPHTLSAWFPEENKIRIFLQKTPKGKVDWTVTCQYGSSTAVRPNSFKFSSVYTDDGKPVRNMDTVGVIRNQAPRQGV